VKTYRHSMDEGVSWNSLQASSGLTSATIGPESVSYKLSGVQNGTHTGNVSPKNYKNREVLSCVTPSVCELEFQRIE